MDDYRDRLRKLAIRDEELVAAMLAGDGEPARAESALDAKTDALVRLSTTVAVDGGQASYQHAVERALAAGLTTEEIVGTLFAVASLTGVPRAVSAAPKLGLALGYDVDAALDGGDT
jgi:4-carboxymuconolactone decarboxylase